MRFSGGNTIEEAAESRRPQLSTVIPKPATSSVNHQPTAHGGCWACSGAPAPEGDPRELVLAIGPVEPYEDLPYTVDVHPDLARSATRSRGGTAVMGGPPCGDSGVDRGGARVSGDGPLGGEASRALQLDEDRPGSALRTACRRRDPASVAAALWRGTLRMLGRAS